MRTTSVPSRSQREARAEWPWISANQASERSREMNTSTSISKIRLADPRLARTEPHTKVWMRKFKLRFLRSLSMFLNLSNRKICVPTYGNKKRWNGHLRTKSEQIKENTFLSQVNKCSRLDKAIVYHRTRH